MKHSKSYLAKSLLSFIVAAVISVIMALAVCNHIITANADGKLYTKLSSVPEYEFGLLLGTTPQTRVGRHANQFFKYRIDAAVGLYKAGKVKKILISGDEQSLDGINEAECMRDTLAVHGVKPQDVILDGKGYHTLDAVVRAVNVYNLHSFVVISQKFHCERAIYLAEHLGLDVRNIVGFNAKDATSGMAMMTYIREYFARVKVFVDILSGKKPKEIALQPSFPCNDAFPATTMEELDGLICYKPAYSSIDLTYSTMPSKDDSNVIFCAEAAFTGELLKEFKHSNILGDHVCSGKRYKGTGCKRNTGAFVYYDGMYRFLYGDYGKYLDIAASEGGMGFCQEMMIHGGKRVPTIRKDANRNEFRALCELNDRLCVIDSKGSMAFGDFISRLLANGVSEALYLDMGPGWNYSWWRDDYGKVHEIHTGKIEYTTNWITFYSIQQ